MPDLDVAVGEGADTDIILEACRASPTFCQRYDINTWTVVGGGHFALVVKLFAKPWGKVVAAKILYKRHLSGPIRDKARQEAVCAERVGGDTIVRVYGPFETEALFWIEMEFVEGRNLQAELKAYEDAGGRLPYARALAIGRAVTDAVSRAHAAKPPIIHRDIKPANILLPASGEPPAKLGDFGISKIGEISKLSRTGGVPGTPLYSPPELRQGRPFGPAGDVYSLGLVLYQLFTGHLPLPLAGDMTEPEIDHVIVYGKPVPPKRYAPDLPENLQDLLLRTLSKKPERRPPAKEVGRVLEDLAYAPPVADCGAVVGSTRTRVRRMVGGSAITTALLIGAGILLREPTVGQISAALNSRAPAPAGLFSPVPSPVATRVVPESVTAEPSPKSAPPVRITYADGVVDLTNSSGMTLEDLRITIVDNRGKRFAAAVPSSLRPGEGAMLAREQFSPGPPVAFDPVEAEIVARGPEGPRRFLAAVDHQ